MDKLNPQHIESKEGGMSSPLVSIVVSCYNHEKYIKQALESCLNQTYPNIELIVLDDGSTDQSVQIIERLKEEHDFKFLPQKNQGYAAALNRGLENSNGKYFCTFGSDDIMKPEKTQIQVDFMEANPDCAVLGGNAEFINNEGDLIPTRRTPPPFREITFDNLFLETGPGIIAPTAMIRTDILRKEGGWDPEIPLEDMYMWFRMTNAAHRMVGQSETLIFYRKHEANTYKNAEYMYRSMMRTVAAYQCHSGYERVRKILYQRAIMNAAKTDSHFFLLLLGELRPNLLSWKFIRAILIFFKNRVTFLYTKRKR